MRIAVIGTGIAGAASAWFLSRQHSVTVIDGASRPGGHTDTLRLPDGRGAPQSVDTGFIVYNETTYPLLVRLFDELGVATDHSDMSWGLRCERCDLEYAGDLAGVLARPANLLDPSYLGMLRDIGRFNRAGSRAIGELQDPSITRAPDRHTHGSDPLEDGTRGDATIGDFIALHHLGDAFRRHYLLPMVAAIWSSGTATVERFPTRSLLAFFANHGLLGVRSHLEWRTVRGGAINYLERLLAPVRAHLRLGSPVVRVERGPGRATVRTADGWSADFDAIVIATHADDALGLLADPTNDERELLGAWTSSDNERVVHTDATLLPSRRAARASWNYHVADCTSPTGQASLSYGMNRLQSLRGPDEVLVSINPVRPPREGTVIRRDRVTHPTFSAEALATQPELDRLNGPVRTFFAGAWQRWGFHEDGLWSAVRVAEQLDVEWPS